MSFALERLKKSWIEQRVGSRILLLIQQNLLGVFLEINEICAHARTVDTRPSFPPPQRPGYEAKGWQCQKVEKQVCIWGMKDRRCVYMQHDSSMYAARQGSVLYAARQRMRAAYTAKHTQSTGDERRQWGEAIMHMHFPSYVVSILLLLHAFIPCLAAYILPSSPVFPHPLSCFIYTPKPYCALANLKVNIEERVKSSL